MSVLLFLRQYFLLFIFYGFCGWVMESTYCTIGPSIRNKKFKFVNRGFLSGPIVPIYAVSAVLMALTLMPLRSHWYLVALVGMIVSDAVEYFTSWSMELLFHARWWDYSNQFLNIKGRICLRNTIFWGVLSLVFIQLIHPAVLNLYNMIPEVALWPLFGVLLAIFLFDLIRTLQASLSIHQFQKMRDHALDLLEQHHQTVSRDLKELETAVEQGRPEIHLEKSPDEVIELMRQHRHNIGRVPQWKRKRIKHILSIHPMILELPSGRVATLKTLDLSPEVILEQEATRKAVSEFLTIELPEYF